MREGISFPKLYTALYPAEAPNNTHDNEKFSHSWSLGIMYVRIFSTEHNFFKNNNNNNFHTQNLPGQMILWVSSNPDQLP